MPQSSPEPVKCTENLPSPSRRKNSSIPITTRILDYITVYWIRLTWPIHLLPPMVIKVVLLAVEFTPPTEWKITHDDVINILSANPNVSKESIEFERRILESSGTGQNTHWPNSLVEILKGSEWGKNYNGAREECETAIFDVFRNVLKKTGVNPNKIDYLIVNCSIFSPTPSMCAMLVKEFNLRSDIQTYNLSGMGCSANIISVDLARRLLENHDGISFAVVVSTECIAQLLYEGNERSFLLQNTLFRSGATAELLSNHNYRGLAKYKFLCAVRTQSSDKESYEVIFQTCDSKGHEGVRLGKNVVDIAGKVMRKNLRTLAPKILPWTELFKVLIYGGKYIPNFKTAVDHWCIHTGGRGVLDGIQKSLKLSDENIRPSRDVLHEMGNTSSSSIWYEMGKVESYGKLRKGHRILQIAFGSGFKCNSILWLCLRAD